MCRFTYREGISFIEYVVQKLEKGYISLGDDIEIHYPGRKEKCDYRLHYKGDALSHSDICQMLYDATEENGYDKQRTN